VKRFLAYFLILLGVALSALYIYVFYGMAESHPLVRLSIFIEPMIYSAALIFLGLILIVAGVMLLRKNKKPDSYTKADDK